MSVGPDRTMPVDGVIQIAFDRYLLPASVTRQSVVLTDASNQPVEPWLLTHDPVARTVTLRAPRPGDRWLTEGQPYKLHFTLPPNDDVIDRGFRAIDGQTLDPNQPLEIAFYVGPATGEIIEKPVTFCGDVQPIFAMKCSEPTCHGSGGKAAAGLVLDSREGVRQTALGMLAHGSNTSSRSVDPEPPRGVFGINMPIIDPGHPDDSWLLYKIELARLPRVDAGGPDRFVCNESADRDTVVLPTNDAYRALIPFRPEADEIERAILSDFVLGREMPYPYQSTGDKSLQPLTFEEREKIRLWIEQGAIADECAGCAPFVVVPDAGAP